MIKQVKILELALNLIKLWEVRIDPIFLLIQVEDQQLQLEYNRELVILHLKLHSKTQ